MSPLNNDNITCIEGKFYDLTDFKHPGGPVALRCARGRDSTALFESYHGLFRASAARTLATLEITDPSVVSDLKVQPQFDDGVDVYDWSQRDSPFVRAIFSAARSYFIKEAKRRGCSQSAARRAPPVRIATVIVLAAMFYSTLPALSRGELHAAFAAGAFGWLYSVNYWHDCLHFAFWTLPSMNQLHAYAYPWFSSITMWIHQHVIGHHNHPNEQGKDPDIYHAPTPLLRLHPHDEYNASNKGQEHRLALIWFVAIPLLNTKDDLEALFTGFYAETTRLWQLRSGEAAMHLLGRLFWIVTIFAWPWLPVLGDGLAEEHWWRKFLVSMVPITTFSILFMIFTQVGHLHQENVPFEPLELIAKADAAAGSPPPTPRSINNASVSADGGSSGLRACNSRPISTSFWEAQMGASMNFGKLCGSRKRAPSA